MSVAARVVIGAGVLSGWETDGGPRLLRISGARKSAWTGVSALLIAALVYQGTNRRCRSCTAIRGAARRIEIRHAIQCYSGCPAWRAKYSTQPVGHIIAIIWPVPPGWGAFRDRHGRGMGCGGRGSVERVTWSQGGYPWAIIRRARRTALMRTAKPCGPDTRCWCQAVGGKSIPTGDDQPSSRQWRWQDEFVAGESTA